MTPTVLPECPNDGKPIHDGAWLCAGCGKTMRVALERVIDLRGALEATITRQARTRGGGVRVDPTASTAAVKNDPPRFSRYMEPPLVNETAAALNLRASETATAADETVTKWAAILTTLTGAPMPTPVRPARANLVPLPSTGDAPRWTRLEPWRAVTATHPTCDTIPTHPTSRAALLLWRHVDWWRHREDGPKFLDAMLDTEHALTRAVDTTARDSMRIGSCPIMWPNAEGIDEVCGGDVRAWPMPAVESLRELAELRQNNRLPKCLRCETEADASWWLREMQPELSPRVTATELIGVIAYELHWTVTHEQIRQWKHREKISSVGKDSKGRTLYDHVEVVATIREDVERQREKGEPA